MSPRRIAAVALSGVMLAGGGVAFAAATKDGEQAVIDDAAKRLDVSPQKLRDALSAARAAQIDKAVEDGELTQKQADAIKERIESSGRVLGGVGPGRGGPHGHHGPGARDGARGAIITDLAKALGIGKDELRKQLRDGKSVADIAKAEGTSLDGVKSAVGAAAKARADRAVKDGDITRAQADRMLAHLDEAIDHLGERRHGRRGAGPPDSDLRPGSFRPEAADPAELRSTEGAVSS